MKKSAKILLTVSLLAVIIATSLLVGCQSLTGDEGYQALQKAIDNTLHDDNAHIFYWKEPKSASLTRSRDHVCPLGSGWYVSCRWDLELPPDPQCGQKQ